MTGTRHDRHDRIPGWDQARVSAARVVVVGAGALGNEVVKNLALAGVGRIVLCDPDTVALGNLSRTVLFRQADIGRPKARVVAEAVAGLAPGTVVDPRVRDLVSGVGLGELADATVVIGCLDSTRARLQLLGRCALAGAPLVDGGTTPWGGEVRLRLTTTEPCYACTLTAEQRAESDDRWACVSDVPGRPVPSSIVGTAIVAGWSTLVALRTVLGDPPPYRLLRVDGPSGETSPVVVGRDPDCPFHRPLDGPVEPVAVGTHDTVRSLLAELPAGAVPLAWAPFPRPDRGPGAVGRRTLSLRDAEPGTRLEDLGVAPEEVLAVRLVEGEYRWLRLKG
ncbi:ThiF family adenylyltransferase [Amycolatopsis sp. NPDC048633]|uniref:ThiF family adenylyltransferase n=1 Tax=Amycolatopsis sp. NPDC048633 TaxID=3157095 RepID=UPI0033DA35DF